MKFAFNSSSKSSPQKPSLQRPKKGLELKDVEKLLTLRLELLNRVESLPHVSVAKVPYITAVGDMISLPGPWSIEVSSIASSALSTTTSPTNEQQDNLDDDLDNADDSESVSEYGEVTFSSLRSPPHFARGVRSVSNATTSSAVSTLERDVSSQSLLNSGAGNASAPSSRFVVRNEFGHVRIQPLFETLEAMQERGRSPAVGPNGAANAESLRVGGHIVLPPADFDACITAGLGEQHPFAGRYHPITGNVIPETTLLFYGPRSEAELEAIWSLVRKSYEWVFSSCN